MTTVKRECMVMLLPTEKATAKNIPFHLGNDGKLRLNYTSTLSPFEKQFHLYILSNDKPQIGDWYIDDTNTIRKAVTADKDYWDRRPNYFKIIATTDTSLVLLIPDPIIGKAPTHFPQPSPQFIQKYVELYNRGEVIERVMVDYEIVPDFESRDRDNDGQIFNGLKKEQLKVDKNNYITITKIKDSLLDLCRNNPDLREELKQLLLSLSPKVVSIPDFPKDGQDFEKVEWGMTKAFNLDTEIINRFIKENL
jgi:hypothetical protein